MTHTSLQTGQELDYDLINKTSRIEAIFTTAIRMRRELGFESKLAKNVMFAYAEALAEEKLTKLQLIDRLTEIVEQHEIKPQ